MSPRRRIRRRNLISTGGLAVVTGLAGCATMFGGNSVTLEWDTSVPRNTGGLALDTDTVYVCTRSELVTVDGATGERGWEFSTDQNETASRPVIEDGTVFFGTVPFRDTQARLYAVSTAGEAVWNAPLPGGATTSAVNDGSVFTASGVMGGGDAGLFAFDMQSGDREWGVPLDDHPIGSSPTTTEETVYIESGGFAAFDAGTGELNWRNERGRTEVGEAARHSPTVGDGIVYFSYSQGSEVYALDAETGEEQWMTETNARASKPVLNGGTLYVGTTEDTHGPQGGTLYALDATTGDEQWSVTTGNAPLEGPVVHDGAVYTSGHKTLFAIKSDSGEIQWEYKFDNGISAPVLTDEYVIIDTPQSSSSDHALNAVTR